MMVRGLAFRRRKKQEAERITAEAAVRSSLASAFKHIETEVMALPYKQESYQYIFDLEELGDTELSTTMIRAWAAEQGLGIKGVTLPLQYNVTFTWADELVTRGNDVAERRKWDETYAGR